MGKVKAKKVPQVLFAGDSAADGAARYLLGVLSTLNVRVTHLAPWEKIDSRQYKQKYDAFILSDYPRAQLSAKAEAWIAKAVEQGAGFMMIGGWASFSGPFGGYRSSRLEKLLPVQCLKRDDRLNFPGGAHLYREQAHPIFSGLSFSQVPAIVGMNEIIPKAQSSVLLSAKKMVQIGSNVTYDPCHYPLLVIDARPALRTAALTTDLAPHWCGGLVDWGPKTKKIKMPKGVEIEVGTLYIRFASALIRWIIGRI